MKTSMGFFKAAIAASPVTVTYQTTTSDSANLTSYSFSSVAIGAADANRIVIVGILASSASAGAPRSVSSCTIGGIAATQIAHVLGPDRECSALYAAIVPTGTTATIAFTMSGSCGRAAIGVWTMSGKTTVAAFDTLTDSNASADPTGTIDIPANGAAIAVGITGVTSTTTWTGLTERFDANIESTNGVSGASDNFASAQTGLTITQNFASAGNNCMAAASWGP